MVKEVSAMGVARTIFRDPGALGAMARRCSSPDSMPYKGNTCVSPSEAPRCSAQRRISASPGRKARMSPAWSRWARRTVCATSSAAFSGFASSLPRTTSTGNIFPRLSTSGASRSRHKASVSMVADITSIRRSGRSTCCASRVSASATSVVRLRSWNSSKMTTETPSSPGSSTRRRTRTPSVSTSIRVPADTFCSNRIR